MVMFSIFCQCYMIIQTNMHLNDTFSMIMSLVAERSIYIFILYSLRQQYNQLTLEHPNNFASLP